MFEYLDFLLPALVVCVLLTLTHCYLGIHVLMREVIFVDLALAQIAALGAAAAFLIGIETDSQFSYMSSLAFTLLGAMIFAIGRFRDQRVPQEAVIGIVYVVCSALFILILSQSALDTDQVENMLTGRLLFVGWPEIGGTAAVYVAIFAVHGFCWQPFLSISRAGSKGWIPANVRRWDFLFYATFGVVVTLSVRMAGVLTVFSFLIVPAACAAMFFTGVRNRLLVGWGFGLLGSFLGLSASMEWDLPTGAAVVAAFGFLFTICALVYAVRAWRGAPSGQAQADTSTESEPASLSSDSSEGS